MTNQSKSQLKLIVFDYDGVIVDTFQNVFETYQVMCRELHAQIIPQTIEEFRELYGHDTYRELYARLGIQPEQAVQGNDIFQREMLLRERRVFDGIPEVLRVLSARYILVLISMSPEALVRETLEHSQLEEYFQLVVGQSETMPHPKSDGLELAKQVFGVEGTEMLAIGDRNKDYEVANKAGIDTVFLVEYGWNYDRTKYPQAVPIHKPADILLAVEHLNATQMSA